jgi:hypothetical protein
MPLIADRRFFDSSRRSRAAALGLVDRRARGAANQVEQAFARILAIALLGAMASCVDHQHALAREAPAGKPLEPRTDQRCFYRRRLASHKCPRGESLPSLIVTPSSSIAFFGFQGGPFSPSQIEYRLSASTGTISYSISTPSWLTESSDRADRSVTGIRPALTGTGWKKPSSLVQGWGAVQLMSKTYLKSDHFNGGGSMPPKQMPGETRSFGDSLRP